MIQKKYEPENDLFNKLSGLLMMSDFQTTVIEVMLKEMYCRDKKAIAKYEKIRSMAIMKAKKQFGDIQAVENLEFQETIRILNSNQEELVNQIRVLTQEKTDLQEKYQNIHRKLTTSESNYNDMAKAVKSYEKLNQWQELRITEVPKIRKKNSGIIRVQNWEAAVEEFEHYHQKPDVPKVKVE